MNPEEEKLNELRQRIDEADKALIAALADRMAVMKDVAEVKKELGKPIKDEVRQEEALDNRRKWAEEYGVPPILVAQIFRTIMIESVRRQRGGGRGVRRGRGGVGRGMAF